MPVNSVNTAFQGVLSNDRSVICLPRHSSFMIMHTFADWGNTGQNMAESIGNTTVSTTKAHGRIGMKAKGVGEILSSKILLRGKTKRTNVCAGIDFL